MNLVPETIAWHKALLDGLLIGGVWTIPHSGSMILKVAKDMVSLEKRGNDEEFLEVVLAYIVAAGYRIVEKPKPKPLNGGSRN